MTSQTVTAVASNSVTSATSATVAIAQCRTVLPPNDAQRRITRTYFGAFGGGVIPCLLFPDAAYFRFLHGINKLSASTSIVIDALYTSTSILTVTPSFSSQLWSFYFAALMYSNFDFEHDHKIRMV